MKYLRIDQGINQSHIPNHNRLKLFELFETVESWNFVIEITRNKFIQTLPFFIIAYHGLPQTIHGKYRPCPRHSWPRYRNSPHRKQSPARSKAAEKDCAASISWVQDHLQHPVIQSPKNPMPRWRSPNQTKRPKHGEGSRHSLKTFSGFKVVQHGVRKNHEKRVKQKQKQRQKQSWESRSGKQRKSRKSTKLMPVEWNSETKNNTSLANGPGRCHRNWTQNRTTRRHRNVCHIITID